MKLNSGPSKSYDSGGFTLLEMMIAMTILATLTVLTSTSIRSAIQSQQKFEQQIEQDSQVREALRVMEKDIGLAFHHRDTYTTMYNEANQAAASVTPTPPGVPAAPPIAGALPTATPRPTPKELTAFVGDEKSLYFTSLSFTRVQRDEQSSDQAKIGYFLKNCKSMDSRGKSYTSNCLWRRVSPTLDDQIDVADKNAIESVIIENVQDLKFKYFGPDHDDWLPAWKTTDTDAAMKDHFPYAVEIYIKVQNKNDPKSKPVEMRMISEIHFPNNEVKKDASPGASPTASPVAPLI